MILNLALRRERNSDIRRFTWSNPFTSMFESFNFLQINSCIPSPYFTQKRRTISSSLPPGNTIKHQNRRVESFSIRSQAALSASLNLVCICCTQSLPVTNIRAMTRGSVSRLDAANSFRASCRSRVTQGVPFGSHQWNALVVRRISR